MSSPGNGKRGLGVGAGRGRLAAVSAACAACLLLAAGCGDSSQAQSGGSSGAGAAGQSESNGSAPVEDAIAVEVGRVERGSLSSLYSTSATLRADKRATVTARTHGVLRELLVEEGDWVEEGQPMAILEDDEQKIAFDQASATYENKRREFERAESLYPQGLMSEEEFEAIRRESVDAKHNADRAELALSRTVIRATFGGRVLTRYLDVGATVNDGTAVYDIADLTPLYADVQVPERQVAQLRPGQVVRLTTDDEAAGGDAEIERIAPAVDVTTGTVKVTLVVRRAGALRPGSFVRVGIVTDTHENVLLVPRSALVAEGRRWHLFRLDEEEPGRVELIEVVRGFEEADRVEIVESSGSARPLGELDRIVVTGASSLSDGSVVEVLNAAEDETEEGVAGEARAETAETADRLVAHEGRCVAA